MSKEKRRLKVIVKDERKFGVVVGGPLDSPKTIGKEDIGSSGRVNGSDFR